VADPADRLAAWVQAAIRVEDTGDASHFAPLCRIVPEINRREREFMAKAISGFQGCRFDVAIEVRGGRELSPSELWGVIADALDAGNMGPLITELRASRDFDQEDIDALARLFWMLRLTHSRGHGRSGMILPTPAEMKLQLAAEFVKGMQAGGLSLDGAVGKLAEIDPWLDGKNGERGGKLANYIGNRRGSTRRRQQS
jgi:hypothetical protein